MEVVMKARSKDGHLMTALYQLLAEIIVTGPSGEIRRMGIVVEDPNFHDFSNLSYSAKSFLLSLSQLYFPALPDARSRLGAAR
jgi:hypothetical protein